MDADKRGRILKIAVAVVVLFSFAVYTSGTVKLQKARVTDETGAYYEKTVLDWRWERFIPYFRAKIARLISGTRYKFDKGKEKTARELQQFKKELQ